ncbi:MAG: aldo/keto reductase [Pseudanabaenales cyanobacterium]|nr:aldo/keto reductase [Pseudanabaenales cyanobacterium]
MRYRRFGKTNLNLSVFSLGTMRCVTSAEVAGETIRRAVALGVNHLETARGYGNSERYLGKALQGGVGVARSQIYITTKIPPTPDADVMKQQLEASLEHLQLDYVDCLAIHGINTWEHLAWLESPQGFMPAVQQAISAGKIRHLGFSTHGPLELIQRAIATELFEFVNLHYTYFFQRNRPAIDLAHQKDMGVFIISPADKGGMLYTPPPNLVDLCKPFSPLVLNSRFLLDDRRITTLSVGPANPQELDWPLEAVDQDPSLTDLEKRILEQLQTYQAKVLGVDHCRQCYACLPCPEEIHIPEVLRLRNLAVAYGMTEFGQYRYRMFENAGHWFPGSKGNRCTDCGDCLPRCPEQLDIPVLLRDTHRRLNGPERRRLWD